MSFALSKTFEEKAGVKKPGAKRNTLSHLRDQTSILEERSKCITWRFGKVMYVHACTYIQKGGEGVSLPDLFIKRVCRTIEA